MPPLNPAVDEYIASLTQWRDEVSLLRSIVCASGVDEELKWRQPAYTFAGANIVIIGTLKDSCVLGFFKGVLLDDPNGLLRAPGPNTQSARHASFTSTAQIKKHKSDIVALIKQAIQNEKQGARVAFKAINEHPVPEELQDILDRRSDVRAAFNALTPGRRRGYLMHISSAKQQATRKARAEACIPRILAGKGLNDR